MADLDLDDIQGLIARGHGKLLSARFLLLQFGDPARARSWLAGLAPQVTAASERAEERAVHLGLTAEGLRKLGLPEAALASSSNEFRQGMTTEHRQRVLGDEGPSAPGNWRWGGTASAPIDAALLLYATDPISLQALVNRHVDALHAAGISDHTHLDTAELTDKEPFGFRDGISQPSVEGFGRGGTTANTVKAGEFVLGYENEYRLFTDRPLVSEDADPRKILPDAGDGLRDFGRNGSYLVVRQLEQDVAGFWRCLDERSLGPDGASRPDERVRLGAKMVGRWPSGAPLVLAPDGDEPDLYDANDFGYHADDPDGLLCPAGSHVRRSNPRDSLDPKPGTAKSYELNRRHRLLRRGRGYGPPLSIEEALAGGDGAERGIFFACIVGNIARQFEFVQHTWVNNPKFGGGYDETDPVAAASAGSFSIPAAPVREHLADLPSFITVRGGAYFFLPGIKAIRYLASLG